MGIVSNKALSKPSSGANFEWANPLCLPRPDEIMHNNYEGKLEIGIIIIIKTPDGSKAFGLGSPEMQGPYGPP